MKEIFNLCYGIPYGDNQKKWSQVGIMILSGDGKISLRIDHLPLHSFDGWLQAFPADKKGKKKKTD